MKKQKSLSLKRYSRHQSYYRMFIVGCGAFLMAYIFAGIFAPVQNSDAQEVTIHNSASGYYVTITNADNLDLNVDATPVGSIATANDTVNVKTNAPTGYQLYVSASSSNIYNSTDISHSQPYLSPVAGTLDDKKVLGQNTWGFSLDDASTMELASTAIWSGVPDTSTTLISETTGPEYATGVNTKIYYGVNANTTLPSGDYNTTIFYTALAEGVTTPFMQDFTNAECEAMATDTTMKLMDSRNAAIYNIVKAKDGNCWMADNLAISDTTITAADSNINSGSFHIPASSEWNTNDYSQALVHIVTENSTSTISGDAKTPYLGQVYYNWYAATAGAQPVAPTSNVTTSICPKGWRLPENSTETGAKSWSNLMSVYNITTGAELTTTDTAAPQYNLGFSLYYGLWEWDYASEGYQSSNGFFWSSTPSSETYAYSLNYWASGVNLQHYTDKGYGFSIRCVFGDSRTLQDITYMQDINTNICQNTATATSAADIKQLKDNRGKGNNGSDKSGTYGVIKAADGNCWMTDNLNLYNYTISAATSDFDSPSSYTIPAGITATTDWNTNNYQTKKVEVAHGLGQYATQDQSYWGEVFYNWTVAVAKETTEGVTTAPNTSICPKGWTLPTNGDRGVNKSWAKLLDVYGVTTGAQLLTKPLGFIKYYGYWNWYNASEYGQGSSGYFWSGTPSSETNAYYLGYNSGGVNPQDNSSKGYGFSIRCVAR